MKILKERTNRNVAGSTAGNTDDNAVGSIAGNKAGILTALLLFICIISVAYYTWYKNINPLATPRDLVQALVGSGSDVAKDAVKQYEFDFDVKESPVFSIYGEYIAKCSTGGIWFLDKKGETVWTESMTLNKPVIKTNGSELLVADVGASDLFVVDGRTIRWRDKLDAPILNAGLSEDGYVTVIVASKRYNNEIIVYDPYGVKLFQRIIAKDFAVNADISPTEQIMAVSGISTGAYGAYSGYKFYDIEGNEKSVQTFETSGELLPLFWFNKDGSLFAAGDRSVACVDKAGKILWEKQFTGVSGACPAGDKRLAVTVVESDGSQLKLFDALGKEAASAKLQYKPRGMTAVKGIAAVFTGDTVYFYDDRCRNISIYSSMGQIRQVAFFNRQTAAVITNDSVTVISIN